MKNKSIQSAESFIKEYSLFTGQLAQSNNSRIWWATDLASKNRFNSQISFKLQQQDYSPKKVSWLKSIVNFAKKKCGLIYHGLRFYVRGRMARHYLKNRIPTDLPNLYIIKSFAYDHSFKKPYTDAFFGKLPEYLNDKEDVLIFTMILGDFKHCLKQIQNENNYTIIPVETFITFKDIFIAIKELLFCKLEIKADVPFNEVNVADLVNQELRDNVNGIQMTQYLHYAATKNLLRKYSAKTFVQTFENNPWERMCILAVREQCPDAEIVGYQHTVVPQAAVNVFVSEEEMKCSPMPDKVLTVGPIPRDILNRYGSFKKDYVQAACAIRYEYLFDKKVLPRVNGRNILIALEGVPEVEQLVRYVIKQLGNNHQYHLRIRTHPVLPWSYFEKKLGIDLAPLRNFSISADTTLVEDLEWSDVVIYWGSTVVIEALKLGRPVIHFDNGALCSFDPLFALNDFKWTVNAHHSLGEVIQQILRLDNETYNSKQQKALGYISDYFWPVTDESLALFQSKNVFDQSCRI